MGWALNVQTISVKQRSQLSYQSSRSINLITHSGLFKSLHVRYSVIKMPMQIQ